MQVIIEGLHRKISHDIMEVWKRNIQPLYDKEMEEIGKKSKEACGDPTRFEDSYIYELFTTTHVPTWGLFLAGYLPAVAMVTAVLAQKGAVDYPEELDLGNPWEGIDGVDML